MQDKEDEEEEMMRNSAMWYGYIITGDNINKGTTASHQRQEQKSKSLHYFHSYAAKDRVNLEHLSDEIKSFFFSLGTVTSLTAVPSEKKQYRQ